MKNKMADLNNHLFMQLERLSEEGMDAEKIAQEAQRAEAIVKISDQIVRNQELGLKAAQLLANHGDRFRPFVAQIEGKAE